MALSMLCVGYCGACIILSFIPLALSILGALVFALFVTAQALHIATLFFTRKNLNMSAEVVSFANPSQLVISTSLPKV
jgi:hypothetical protein